MPQPYDQGFYDVVADTASHSAAVVVPVILSFVQPASVVDVGCGVGAWLAEFSRRGTADVMGYDGDWVDWARLAIPYERVRAVDLTRPLTDSRRYELAISLETGEHLPAASARTLVQSLVHLSDVVVFSAAIPFQGGRHHVNEQWP